jgi:rSAM/selenodomain-associated transferase 2
MTVSIIVPTLNEAQLIQPFLQHLRNRASEAEIIVADANSSDRTAELAARLADRVVHARPGRATQMNSGALIASNDVLWFLHVDAEVPWSCLGEIQRIMDNPKVVGGFFRIRLPENPVYRLTDCFAHYAGIALRMRCGDHGLFCRRTVFADVGGFPEVPLMEDVEFFRIMRRRGRIVCSPKRIIVSPRRYETVGPLRLTLAYGWIAALYVSGVPLKKLASIYKRACCQREETETAN